MVAETGKQGRHPDVAIGHEFRRRKPGRADRARTQIGTRAIDHGHPDDRRRAGVRRRRIPGRDWVANVRAAGQARLARGRNVRRVNMVELSTDDARPLLRAFPTEVPTGVGFMKRNGLVIEGRPEEFEALAGRCAVFRLDPV
jgi:hypothetical protein